MGFTLDAQWQRHALWPPRRGVKSNRVTKNKLWLPTAEFTHQEEPLSQYFDLFSGDCFLFTMALFHHFRWMMFFATRADSNFSNEQKPWSEGGTFWKTLVWNPKKFGLSWSNLACSYLCWVAQPPPSLWLFYREKGCVLPSYAPCFFNHEKRSLFKIKKQYDDMYLVGFSLLGYHQDDHLSCGRFHIKDGG